VGLVLHAPRKNTNTHLLLAPGKLLQTLAQTTLWPLSKCLQTLLLLLLLPGVVAGPAAAQLHSGGP
jgi:hypothetical protein